MLPLPAEIEECFEPTRGRRTTETGEYLLRIAEAAYGNKLAWPLIWVVNQEMLPDPEVVPKGSNLTVGRLLFDFGHPTTDRGLDIAYQMTYRRYASLSQRTDLQRQWVVSQAQAAGIDVNSDTWGLILTPGDKNWLGTAQNKRPAPSLSNLQKTDEIVLFNTPASRQKFLQKSLEGAPLTLTEMEDFIKALEDAPEKDSVIKILEAAADKPDTPPQVAFLLALSYSRQGLHGKEYLYYRRAAEQANKRPQIIFNLLMVHSRMELLRNTQELKLELPSDVKITSTPPGASVTANGMFWGFTPVFKQSMTPGTYKVRISNSQDRDVIYNLDLDYGVLKELDFNLGKIDIKLKTVRIDAGFGKGAFLMGAYEITQGQWEEVMLLNPGTFTGKDLPVDGISRDLAMEFCNELSKLEGLPPYYLMSFAADTVESLAALRRKFSIDKHGPGTGYRLPTLEEWRLAARDSPIGSKDFAWMEGEAMSYQPVGMKAPNSKGLYDMGGNVWELLEEKAQIGGDFLSPRSLASTDRDPLPISDSYRRLTNVGLRVVRNVR